MYKLQQKLKALKAKIKIWNKEDFGNIFADKRTVELRIQGIQSIWMIEGYTQGLRIKEQRLNERLEE